MVALDEPVEGAHGGVVSERVGQVVYTAETPIPEGLRRVPDPGAAARGRRGRAPRVPGAAVVRRGRDRVERVPGADGSEREHPAPAIEVTAAEGDGHGHADTASMRSPRRSRSPRPTPQMPRSAPSPAWSASPASPWASRASSSRSSLAADRRPDVHASHHARPPPGRPARSRSRSACCGPGSAAIAHNTVIGESPEADSTVAALLDTVWLEPSDALLDAEVRR